MHDRTQSEIEEMETARDLQYDDAARGIVALIDECNAATNPSVPRTDAEHEECRERARKAMNAIRSNFREGRDYRELSNGMLWPLTPGFGAF